MPDKASAVTSVLITGAQGYLGRKVVAALAQGDQPLARLLACDLQVPPPEQQLGGVEYVACDVRSAELAQILAQAQVQVVVHLAAVVNPGPKADRTLLHQVEVLGTGNVLECCLKAGVERIIVSSSGAAYGYYPDNAPWLGEDDPLRGNPEFIYSDHKRQVEEMLARWREEHPELGQLILRPGTILGAGTRNQITDLFDRPRVLGIRGSETPFVFIWDQDVARVIVQGIFSGQNGIFNLAGDGAVPMRELAGIMGKPYVCLPAWLVKGVLGLLKALGLTQYGPEQVNFLRYRPVLDNRRLKEEFGYTPQKTSRQVFELFWAARQKELT